MHMLNYFIYLLINIHQPSTVPIGTFCWSIFQIYIIMLLQKLKNSGVWMTIKIHYIKYIYAHPPRTVGHKSAVHYPNKVER